LAGRLSALRLAEPGELDTLDEDGLVGVMAALERLTSQAAAAQLAVIARLTRLRGGPRFVEDEIAAELRISRPAAAHRLDLALQVDRLPAVAAGLAAGQLDTAKARAIGEAVGVLDAAPAAAVAAEAVRCGTAQTVGQLRAWLRRRVLAADPAAAQARHEQAASERRVTLTGLPDGMAELWALLPADGAARAYAAVDGCARHAASPGDHRGADARRADALVDLLTGQSTAPAATVQLTVPLATLLAARAQAPGVRGGGQSGEPDGIRRVRAMIARKVAARGLPGERDAAPAQPAGPRPAPAGQALGPRTFLVSSHADQASAHPGEPTGPPGVPSGPPGERSGLPSRSTARPERGPAQRGVVDESVDRAGEQLGELAGIGPIPVEMARRLAADGLWRWLATDHGSIVGVGTHTYRPPAALAALIRGRDQTCRFPGCRQPAHRCDLDHTTPFPAGGTTADNLATLCRHHHRLKHQTRWAVSQHPGGRLTWTSPTGRTYITSPHEPVGTAGPAE
jgi:hypothetical protein